MHTLATIRLTGSFSAHPVVVQCLSVSISLLYKGYEGYPVSRRNPGEKESSIGLGKVTFAESVVMEGC